MSIYENGSRMAINISTYNYKHHDRVQYNYYLLFKLLAILLYCYI